MPAEQRGSAYRTGKGWGVRWFVNGKERQHASGFRTKSEALRYYRDTIAPRLRGSSTMPASIPLSAFVEHYLEAHAVGREASTIAVLRERLRYATRAFGDVPLADLERRVPEIAAWQARLPSGIRYGATQALRQALDAGVRWGVLATNPAKRAGRNPAPKRAEIEPFTSDELLWLAAELGPWGSVVQFAAATGLRPAEWIALERRDVRRDERVVIVERSFSRGVLRPYGKTARSRRRVPLSRAALDALALQPLRIDTQLVFPAREGGHLDLHNWRSREWIPAVDAAGLRRGRRVYDLRHTFATNALAAGISLYELARFMGTSVRMIDQTYGHLAHGAENAAWEKLDAFADRAR